MFPSDNKLAKELSTKYPEIPNRPVDDIEALEAALQGLAGTGRTSETVKATYDLAHTADSKADQAIAKNASLTNEQAKDRSALLTMLETSIEYEKVAQSYIELSSNTSGNGFRGFCVFLKPIEAKIARIKGYFSTTQAGVTVYCTIRTSREVSAEIASASALKVSTKKEWVTFDFDNVDISNLDIICIGFYVEQNNGAMSFAGGSGDPVYVYTDENGKNSGYLTLANENGNYGLTTNSCPALEVYKASADISISNISAVPPTKIYAYQDSEDPTQTPPIAVYLDSVLTAKQKVAFTNGLDRIYMMPNNQVVQDNDVKISTISEALKGTGYHDLNLSFALITTKTSVATDKSAKLLVIGDSVTAGYNANVNNADGQPNTYWGVAAELAFAKFDSFEMLGGNASDKVDIEGVMTTVKAEGRGGWKLYDFLFSETINSVTNQFYDSSKTWTDEDLNTAGVKFSLSKYLTDNSLNTPTHVVIQLGFNDTTESEYIANMQLMLKSIKEEYSDMVIGISLPRDYGTWFQEYYKDYVLNQYSNHGGLLNNKLIPWTPQLMALEDAENKIFYIPTYFVTPTAEAIPTTTINGIKVTADDDAGYHPNHIAHVAWGHQLFAWLLYTMTLSA